MKVLISELYIQFENIFRNPFGCEKCANIFSKTDSNQLSITARLPVSVVKVNDLSKVIERDMKMVAEAGSEKSADEDTLGMIHVFLSSSSESPKEIEESEFLRR